MWTTLQDVVVTSPLNSKCPFRANKKRILVLSPFSPTRDYLRLVCNRESAQCSLEHRELRYCNFAYSALARFRTGTSGSAFFHSIKKSW